MKHFVTRCAGALAIIFLLSNLSALAQSEQSPLDRLAEQLSRIESAVRIEDPPADILIRSRNNISEIRSELSTFLDSILPEIESLQNRMSQFDGASQDDTDTSAEETDEPPTNVTGEDAQADRAQLEERLNTLSDDRARAQSLLILSDDLLASIAEKRRQTFAEQLFSVSASLVDPALFSQALDQLQLAQSGFSALVRDWTEDLFTGLSVQSGIQVVIWLAVIFAAIIASRAAADWIRSKRKTDLNTNAGLRTLPAFARFIRDFAIPSLFIGAGLFAVTTFASMPANLAAIIRQFALCAVGALAAYGLLRAFLSPGSAKSRLVPVTNSAATRLVRYGVLIATANGIYLVLDKVSETFALTLSFTVFFGGWLAIVQAALMILFVRTTNQGLREKAEQDNIDAPTGGWRILLPIAALLAMITILAALTGYVSFGRFLATQSASIGLIIGFLALVIRLIDVGIARLFSQDSAFADVLSRNIGLKPEGLPLGGIVFSGVLKTVIGLIALLAAILPWGIDGQDLVQSFNSVAEGFSIGEARLSPTAIFAGLVSFVLVIILTRLLRGWLENRFLPATQMDIGLQNSIAKTVGYIGFVVAGLYAFNAIGVDLSQLAIVAGALSVGIGFGLQSIVNNFVSGLILLAERPIKQGDWVIAGGTEGTVRRINVRATEIETFDQATVVIPNSELVSGRVTNWVLGDTRGRIGIDIGVGYDSDPDKVKELLIEVANSHPLILSYPAPAVYFLDFGDSALVFGLRAYLADIGNGYSTRSDLRFEILRRFREAEIEIPFPQRDVNVRNLNIELPEKSETDPSKEANS